jgi:hypothetical protein
LIRAVGSPYEEINRSDAEKEVVNQFKLEVLNQSFEQVHFTLPKDSALEQRGIQIVSAALPLKLSPGEARRIDVFIRFPLSQIKDGRGKIQLATVASSNGWNKSLIQSQEVSLVGPLR